MLARTEGTYRKLSKIMSHVDYETASNFLYKEITLLYIPIGGLKVLTRGNNRIAYYRPDGGKKINDKVWMYHWNNDGTVDVYI